MPTTIEVPAAAADRAVLIAALRSEREVYRSQGRTDRADAVTASLAALGDVAEPEKAAPARRRGKAAGAPAEPPPNLH